MYLQDFKILRPHFEANQEKLLDWIVSAQSQARKRLNQWEDNDPDYLEFTTQLRENLYKLGLGEKKIQKRGFHIPDFYHKNWDEMEIFNLASYPEGHQLDHRMEFFNQSAMDIFEKFYPNQATLPSHLIHVTCTGYVAPSPAQRLVSLREKGRSTMVTHAYHMGCYGAIPSLRMAMGHLAVEKGNTDIVHTEFCTLHMNPTLHSMEQLVVQSLFADGFIKYNLGYKDNDDKPRLKILSVLEEVIENSTEKMTWKCNPWGFRMTISKDIPVLIRKNIEGYIQRLLKRANKENLKKMRFAIHPGGPKIIEQVAEKLNLDDEQIRHSLEILQTCGNMSSATLPHIWESMLKDPKVKDGEEIISLAFGPGLTISGGYFEKIGSPKHAMPVQMGSADVGDLLSNSERNS